MTQHLRSKHHRVKCAEGAAAPSAPLASLSPASRGAPRRPVHAPVSPSAFGQAVAMLSGARVQAMADDDIYERHQMMTALTGVLLHDLRNPLHSATLLVEALGTGGDVSALRTKLRAQFAKLDGLISTAAAPIRELAVDP